MAQHLKRWESPRKQGRNQKGRGGSARQRQLKKRHKQFLKQLKAQAHENAKLKRDGQAPKDSLKLLPDSRPGSQLQIARKGQRFQSLTLSFAPLSLPIVASNIAD